MLITATLPPASGLLIDGISTDAGRIMISLAATRPVVPCPLCRNPATRVHRRYTRTLADLPWQGWRSPCAARPDTSSATSQPVTARSSPSAYRAWPGPTPAAASGSALSPWPAAWLSAARPVPG